MSSRQPHSSGRKANWRRRPLLAASLALALTAAVAAVLFRPRAKAPELSQPSYPADCARDAAVVALQASEPNVAPVTAGLRPVASRDEISAAKTSPDALTKLQQTVPALERAEWDKVTAALQENASRKGLPRALGALALELAGDVRTTAGSGLGELTHPTVLSRLLEELLARQGEPLSAAQREEAANLAGQSAAALDRLLAAAPGAPQLASTIAEVELKLELIDGVGEILTPAQREVLDRLVAYTGGGEAVLSPLGLIESLEVDWGSAEGAFERAVAMELARDFEIDPGLADSLAAELRLGLTTLLDGSAPDLSKAERALIAGRAQSQMLAEVLRAPGLSEEARARALRVRTATVPRVR